MRSKVLIVLLLLAAIVVASVIFQIALGIFKIGFWIGIAVTLTLAGIILFKPWKKNPTDTN